VIVTVLPSEDMSNRISIPITQQEFNSTESSKLNTNIPKVWSNYFWSLLITTSCGGRSRLQDQPSGPCESFSSDLVVDFDREMRTMDNGLTQRNGCAAVADKNHV
jgi:hypothetical protein